MTPRPHGDGVLSAALAWHLASLELVRYPPAGSGVAWPGYVESLPDAPDEAVVILSRAGFPSLDLSGYETPELQVIVRGAAGPVRPARTLAERIRRALHDTDTVTWADGTPDVAPIFTCVANEPSPLSLGFDPNGRPQWSVSFQITHLTEEVAP